MTEQKKEPKYFAVLSAAYRHPEWVSFGQNPSHWYYRCERDDPEANEFRAQLQYSWYQRSISLGRDRLKAESMLFELNKAYEAGINKDIHLKRGYSEVLVGRTGALNRNEESIP